MADGIKLEIVSPERLVISEDASSVTVPGAEGYFTVLGDHAPLMTILKPGFVTAVVGGASQVFYVRGGFADVSPDGLTILAEDARPVGDFDRPEIEAMIAETQKSLEGDLTMEDRAVLQAGLDNWRNLLLEAASTAGPPH